MKCEDIIEKITSGKGKLGIEEKAHIAKCQSCKNLRQGWKMLRDVRPRQRDVSLNADFAIHSEARVFAERRGLRHTRSAHRWISFGSAAACVLFFAMAYVSFLRNPSGGEAAPGAPAQVGRLFSAQDNTWNNLGLETETLRLREELDSCMRALFGSGDSNAQDSQKAFMIDINELS